MSVLYALCAALATSLYDVMSRSLMPRGISPWFVGMHASLFGGALLAPLLFLVPYDTINLAVLLVLVASNSLWAASVFFDLKSYITLEAAEGAMIDTISLLLLLAAGLVFFGEGLETRELFGLVLIVFGLLFGVNFRDLRKRTGRQQRYLSVLCATGAFALDKYLVETVSPYLVLPLQYVVPGLLLFIMKPHHQFACFRIHYQREFVRLCAQGIFLALTGYFLVMSLYTGPLWMCAAFYRLRVVFVYAFGLLLLGEGQRRLPAVLLCSIGGILIAI